MSFQIKLKRAFLFFSVMAVFLAAAGIAYGQEDKTSKKRLRSPATVKGTIGGESHASYVISARKGQTLSVQISWRRKNDNRAEFTVSQSANFFNGGPVKFGKETDGGKSWSGRIPRTGNYYIYVVANPSANYTLKVTVK